MKPFCWTALSLLCLSLATAGCPDGLSDPGDSGYPVDGDYDPPDFWDPGDKPDGGCGYGDGGDGCQAAGVDCAEEPCIHGECVTDTNGGRCVCETGYTGELCERCAEGYITSGLSCVPAEGCADSPCVYGTCRPQPNEEFECDCDTGYAGRLCDECATGYHIEGMRCVPD